MNQNPQDENETGDSNSMSSMTRCHESVDLRSLERQERARTQATDQSATEDRTGT